MKPCTSNYAVEARASAWESAAKSLRTPAHKSVPFGRNVARLLDEAAALLRALVAERDGAIEDAQRLFGEAELAERVGYARGFREGAEKMREGAAKAATTASRSGVNLCPYGRDRPGDPTWNHTEDDLCPVCRKNGDESLHFCTDSVGGNIAAAISALPLPEPQA